MNIVSILSDGTKCTGVEKGIADYFLTHKDDVFSMSTAELAAATYTSKSAITRFCQKLGFNGFNDFKIEFAAQLQKESSQYSVDADFPFGNSANFMEISKNIYELMEISLTNTYKKMSTMEYQKAISLLAASKRKALFALGDNMAKILSFQNKMSKIGVDFLASPLPLDDKEIAFSLSPADCAIIVSYSGQTNHLVYIAETLHEHKVPYIAICGYLDSTIAKNASVILELSDLEKQSMKLSNFSSQISIELCLNTLYGYYFSINYSENTSKRISVDQATSPFFINSKKR